MKGLIHDERSSSFTRTPHKNKDSPKNLKRLSFKNRIENENNIVNSNNYDELNIICKPQKKKNEINYSREKKKINFSSDDENSQEDEENEDFTERDITTSSYENSLRKESNLLFIIRFL
jgi:hypothetical protein